jgi:hypothetical protein
MKKGVLFAPQQIAVAAVSLHKTGKFMGNGRRCL